MIVKFPYKFYSLKKSTKLKYIHIGCVIAVLVISLIIALIPIIRAASGDSVQLGYNMISTVSLFCYSKSNNIVLYISILPSLLMAECGVALLIVTTWLIHKVIITCYKVSHEYLIQIYRDRIILL